MNKETKELYEETLVDNLESMKELEVGTDEYSKAAKIANEQMEKLISIEKMEHEKAEAARKSEEFAADREDRQAEEERKGREFEELRDDKKAENEANRPSKFDKVIKGLEIGIPILLFGANCVWNTKMTNKILRFEETGSVTSLPGRSFFQTKLFKK